MKFHMVTGSAYPQSTAGDTQCPTYRVQSPNDDQILSNPPQLVAPLYCPADWELRASVCPGIPHPLVFGHRSTGPPECQMDQIPTVPPTPTPLQRTALDVPTCGSTTGLWTWGYNSGDPDGFWLGRRLWQFSFLVSSPAWPRCCRLNSRIIWGFKMLSPGTRDLSSGLWPSQSMSYWKPLQGTMARWRGWTNWSWGAALSLLQRLCPTASTGQWLEMKYKYRYSPLSLARVKSK